jgi:hypothetical protein
MTDPSFRRPDWPRAPQKSRPHFLSATKWVAPSARCETSAIEVFGVENPEYHCS